MIDDSYMDPYRIYNPQLAENTVVYGILVKWPLTNKVILGSPKMTESTSVELLGYKDKVKFYQNPSGGITIDLGSISWQKLPNLWAWVFKFERLQSEIRDPFNPDLDNNADYNW